MAWYYGQDVRNESELLSGLNEKAHHARDSTGWEFAVIGILDVNVYIRLATAGLKLSILPRGETLCAHPVTQPPGNVFQLPNMLEDWRFRESPYVEQGGLVAYAGIPLRMQHESGECVGLGSLCVASSTPQPPLSKQQQHSLTRLADWVVADMVQSTRIRRQRERHRLSKLLESFEDESDDPHESILGILRLAYPNESISIQPCSASDVYMNGRYTGLQSDLQNGLWEDDAYIDDFITNSNHQDTPKDDIRPRTSDGYSTTSMLGSFKFLVEANKVKETFIRGISHQLRTPIHGILGAVELLADDVCPGDTETSSAYISTISMAGRDLMSTVNSMTTLNRWADIAAAERKSHVHHVSELEAELIAGVPESRLNTASMTSLFFHDHLSQDTSSLRTDLNLLRNSLLPLVINAIQATEHGIVTITFSLPPGTTHLQVDIEDTGCGIPGDDQERVFELYEKVGEHSTRAGLGLTVATKYSTLLQGSIKLVSSEVNRGSHFRATFRNLVFSTPVRPSTPIPSSLKRLPLSFRQTGSDSQLLSNFAQFLIRSGLTPSESSQDCFHITEIACDSKHSYDRLSVLSSRQAVICLIPTTVLTTSLQPLPNVTFLNAPFTTTNLLHALYEADQSTTATVSSRLPWDVNQSTQMSLHRPFEENQYVYCSSSNGSRSDEGELHTSGSTFLGESQAASGSDSSLDDMSMAGQSVLSGTPAKPLPVTRSAKPIVLVVDDNAINLRILQMYCKSRGLDCFSATNGKEAVEVFSSNQAACNSSSSGIELILMDLQMPVCDGLDATQQIRSLEKRHGWSPSVLFMVTGQDSRSDREAATAAGADDYLVKPVGPKFLDSKLKKIFSSFDC